MTIDVSNKSLICLSFISQTAVCTVCIKVKMSNRCASCWWAQLYCNLQKQNFGPSGPLYRAHIIIAMAFVKKRCNCTPASFCFQKTLIITPVWLHVHTSAFFSIFRSSGTYCSQVAVWSIIYWTPWAPAKRVQGGRPTLIVFCTWFWLTKI